MAKRKKKPGHRSAPLNTKSAKAAAKKRADAAGAWNELRQLPTSALISTINTMVEILQHFPSCRPSYPQP